MDDLQSVAILGAGGHAREVLDVVDAINAMTPTFKMLGFVVDPEYGAAGEIINDHPILGGFDWLGQHTSVQVICGVGYPELRRQLTQRAQRYGVEFCTLVHPQSVTTRWLTMGTGVVISAGCVLTNQIVIGAHAHINRNSTVGHDCDIGAFVTLSPGVNCSGNVTIGEGCFVGTGANIIEGLNIGAWSKIGAGSTVIKDVEANHTVVGTPARSVRQRAAGWHLDV